MNCDSVRQNLSLLLYGELSFDAEEAMEGHLAACDACRKALETERAVHAALHEAENVPSLEFLAHCRTALRASLDREREPASSASQGRRWRIEWVIPSWNRAVRVAGAVTLLAVGFLAARLTVPGGAGLWPAGGSEPVWSRVRYVEPDGSGRVKIVLDETRQRVLSGRLEEASIRNLLLAAAKDPADPGLRAESLDILKDRSELTEVREALLAAVQRDPNPGVRLKALEGLRPFARDSGTRKALARVLLQDDNPGVRTLAIDILVKDRQPDLAGILQESLRREDNSYVRYRGQKALREMNASTDIY